MQRQLPMQYQLPVQIGLLQVNDYTSRPSQHFNSKNL
jgi:hypothetical protein